MATDGSRSPRFYLAGLALCLAAARGFAAAPTLTAVDVADVTPSGATLVWEVDGAAAASTVRVFADAAGTQEITSDFAITAAPLAAGDPAAADEQARVASLSALRAASSGKGLARVRIDGLAPATTYYVRARSSMGTDAAELPAGQTIAVTTMDRNSFVSAAHQLRVRLRHPDPRGWVVLASSAATPFAVSSVVGDGAAADEAFINVAQLFSAPTANYEPSGPTTINLRIRDGSGSPLSPSFDITFMSGFAVGIVSSIEVGDDEPPPTSTLRMTKPAVLAYTEGEAIVLAWQDELPPGSAIDLFFDVNGSGADGAPLAAGVAADPDGAGDSYLWSTAGVADGVYWVYARSAAGVSYAPAPVAIDRGKSDGDGDRLSDVWERLYFGSLVASNGHGDLDFDGRFDLREFLERTLPLEPDFRLRADVGLSFFSLPIISTPSLSSADLLAQIGAAARSIARIDVASQLVETTTWDGVTTNGPVFPLVPGEGYMLTLASGADELLVGDAAGVGLDLDAGVNLAGFRFVPAGYSAFQLLDALGGDAVVTSVGRIEPRSQRFENAAYADGVPVGYDFPIVVGEAYLIHLKQSVGGFEP
jgi:hypothetical protein